MAVADFQSKRKLVAWLNTMPLEVSWAIAARAALRLFPVMRRLNNSKPLLGYDATAIVLPSLRGMALPWVVARHSNHSKTLKYAAAGAYVAASHAAAAAAAAHELHSAYVAASSASDAAYTLLATPSDAASSASDAALATGANTALQIDCEFIDNGGSVRALCGNPLWLDKQPDWVHNNWIKLQLQLRTEYQDWEVWIRWYDAVLHGRPTPGGEALDVFRVTLDSEDDWEKGPAHVNQLIEARERELTEVSKSASAKPVEQAAKKLASRKSLVKATITKGKLALVESTKTKVLDSQAEAMLAEVQKQVTRLADRAKRLGNTHPEFSQDILELADVVRGPIADIAASSLKLWGLSLSMAEHLQIDDEVRVEPDPRILPLERDDRQTLSAVVTRLAPFVRMLPGSKAVDTKFKDFAAAPDTLDAAQKLFDAAQGNFDFIEAYTFALVRRSLANAVGKTNHAGKAAGFATESAKGLAQEATLFTRRGFFKAVAIGVVTGVAKKTTEATIEGMGWDEDMKAWIQNNRETIKDLFKNEPLDIRKALELLLDTDEPLVDPPDDMMDT